MSSKAQSLGRQVGGRAGIEKEIKRGRRALTGLDAIVKRAFRDQSEVLEKWRIAKRLHGVRGGNGAASDAAPDVTAAESAAAEMQIRVPTLVLSAAGNPGFQNAQRRVFPNADHVTLSGNHWLHVSNVEGVAREVLAWLGANRL